MRRWWRRRSLRLRLTALSSGVLALGLALGVLGLSVLFTHARTAALDAQLQAESATLRALVSTDQLTQPLPSPPGSPVLAQVVDSAGTVLASTSAAGRVLPLAPPATLAALSGSGAQTVAETGYGAGPLRVLVTPATMQGTPVEVVAAASVADLDSTVTQLRRVLLLVAPLTVLAAGLASWLAIGAALQPVDEMRAAAEAIGRTAAPDERLPVPPTGDEVARLATTLNSMLARLEAASRQQRDFAADAAHELRTPLTTLLAGLDVARAGGDSTDWNAVAARTSSAGRRLAALIDDLLLLARTDTARPLRSEPVDLTAMVAETLAADRRAWGEPTDAQAPSSSSPRLIGTLPQATVVVDGDQASLERLVRNLLDNAHRYATAVVRIELVRGPGTVTLVVSDDGPGVPSEQLESIFERFHRVDDSRARTAGGSGLGLAIVQQVARAHGGTATAENAPGGGLSVRVQLPLTSRT